MVSRQASGLSRKAIEVCAIIRLTKCEKPGIKEIGDIKVGQFFAPPNRSLKFTYQHLRYPAVFYRNLYHQSPFSAVIAHQPFNCFALLMLRKISGLPLIYNFHSPSHLEYLLSVGNKRNINNSFSSMIRRQVEWFCLHNANVIMTESQYMKQKVIDIHHIADDRILVNPGGVDLDRFCEAKSRKNLKRELGLPAGRIHVLTVRNLEPRMGLDHLVKAISLLKGEVTDVHLIIGGEGPERQYLEHMIHRYDLSDDVTMTGFIPVEQLPQYYQAADFFVLPTRDLEGFGLVTVESLACGTPVLGTPVGGTVEILSGFDNAFLFSDTSPEAIAKGIAWAINCWLKDGPKYERLRASCRTYVEKKFSWQRHINQLNSIIDNLIASSRPNNPCDAGLSKDARPAGWTKSIP